MHLTRSYFLLKSAGLRILLCPWTNRRVASLRQLLPLPSPVQKATRPRCSVKLTCAQLFAIQLQALQDFPAGNHFSFCSAEPIRPCRFFFHVCSFFYPFCRFTYCFPRFLLLKTGLFCISHNFFILGGSSSPLFRHLDFLGAASPPPLVIAQKTNSCPLFPSLFASSYQK